MAHIQKIFKNNKWGGYGCTSEWGGVNSRVASLLSPAAWGRLRAHVEGAGEGVFQGQIPRSLHPGPDASISQPPHRMWKRKLQVHLVNYSPSIT